MASSIATARNSAAIVRTFRAGLQCNVLQQWSPSPTSIEFIRHYKKKLHASYIGYARFMGQCHNLHTSALLREKKSSNIAESLFSEAKEDGTNFNQIDFEVEEDDFLLSDEPKILLINDDTNEKIGVIRKSKAENIAKNNAAILKCVAPNAKPPVYRMISKETAASEAKKIEEKLAKEKKEMKLLRQQQAKEYQRMEAEKKVTKELKLTALAHDHDIELRINKARQFLSKGKIVKFTLYKKRGQLKQAENDQRAVLETLISRLSDVGQVSSPPEKAGHRMSCVLRPKVQQK
eukprot:m.67351 g.67351  ORF g.67351 m.67351 type:complete len:291 (-) comp11880_c0_seq3:196-1068(-)